MSYETEEQQVEALKEWWDENGRAVLLGVGLGILIIAAYNFWQNRKEANAVAASDLYSQSVDALRSGDAAKAQELAVELSGDHSGTLYASYARMAAARAAIEAGDIAAAADHLKWAVSNTDQPDVKVIAQMRLARVNAELGDVEAGLKALPKSVNDAFKGQVEEVRGDLQLLSGDVGAARQAYEAALEAGGVTDPATLQIKLNDLAEPADAS